MSDTSSASPPYFASDNGVGVSPEILAALAAANEGAMYSYGADAITARVERRLSEVFEREVAVFLVSTGTAANALSLATFTPPWGAVLCHADAHIEKDECGAVEFFGAGARLVHVAGARGLIDPQALATAAQMNKGDVHGVQPACVSITQASELGTLYSRDHLNEIGRVSRAAGLTLHMDGARFANALVALDVTPAEMTWKAGVDVLSFGATKNGAMGVEAVVLFDPAKAQDMAFRRKRAGHLMSKMRFLAAQMAAYLDNDLWLANARHANAMAGRLEAGLRAIAGIEIIEPAEANMLFVRLPQATIDALLAQGFRFYSDRWGSGVIRLVASFATKAEEVDAFVAGVRAAV
ncbi:threonine aldolase family protein [Ancylobacter sp. SL191]|uniref:threonine aldolase family protein n=1 Tax=Ancylobacter sp. SL191 TaxID=2995166 RepID=UPI00226ED4A3|nr:low specificity L-threonine aldolase [Ancylobacter sp. SL191]WAC28446.1 low specificity L-threonine aldolase [Ancylobacter sp. SL191]